jgi:ubiquinone/menaquinone biosynthesis C-methylase UbiE
MKRDAKFYAMLRDSSNLQHSADYARGYREEDERSKDDISHAGKCKIIRELSAAFKDQPTVLDLGCGTGRYFHCLAKQKLLVGVDPSEHMLRQAQHPVNHTTTHVQLVRGSLHDIEFKPNCFDIVLCIGVFGVTCPLDHFSFNHIAGFLKTNGFLFFTVPEFLPVHQTWKRRMAQLVEPFMIGYAKRYVRLRLRKFATTEKEVSQFFAGMFGNVEIGRWQSGTGRVDLHCTGQKLQAA